MTEYDWGGWLIFTNGTDTYKIKTEDQPIPDDVDKSAFFIHYPSDGHYAFTLDTHERSIKLKKLWFISKVRVDQFIAFIESAQSNENLTLRIQDNSSPTYLKWDGTNTTMPILYKNKKGPKKLFGGDSDIWEITIIHFEIRDSLSA